MSPSKVPVVALCLAVIGLAGAVHAQQAPSGPPPEIAAQIRALGPVVNVPAVNKLYEPLLARQPTANVTRTNDIAYGPDERHKLDTYRPEQASSERRPAVIFFHGGGFVRGDKAERSNIGYFFARNGVVAILSSYRLAPKNPWPAGPEDVVAALNWVKANGDSLGIDPNRIFLMGESAGAAHVASAVTMPRFRPADGLGIAGAVLLSGVYGADLEFRAKKQFGLPTPDPRNDAYFGTDPERLGAMSIVLNLKAPLPPILLAYAELDPPQMQIQAGEMFAALCRAQNTCPDLLWMKAHNHGSAGSSFNTEDDTVSRPVLDFILSKQR
jgi:triacylglycerol lipase